MEDYLNYQIPSDAEDGEDMQVKYSKLADANKMLADENKKLTSFLQELGKNL